MKKFLHLLLLLTGLNVVSAQSTLDKKTTGSDRPLVQFSGIVVEHDSLRPIPYTAILVANTKRGTISDFYGYFSFVAQLKDTIEFTAVGFKPMRFIIPDTLTTNRYSLIQVLTVDTVFLQETTIYPWPTREQFRQAFLNLGVNDDAMSTAQKNLDRETMQIQYNNLTNDASMSYKAVQQQQYSRLYYAGQAPPNNLLNPVAWSKFIQAWRNGEFRKKDEEKIKKK
ncbi:MAG TPA: carboxypeptidase-like regulatory domain-containing protein [Bacteroidia bacterium]|jgi:hypothetical protein